MRAPRWVDPDQHWLHLPHRRAELAADALGRQLALQVDGPSADDGADPPGGPPGG